MKPILSLLALTITVRALAVDSAPVHAMPARPTEQQIRQLLAGGLELIEGSDEPVAYMFRADGLATFSTGGVPTITCARPAPYRTSGHTISFTCPLASESGDGTLSRPVTHRFSIDILMLAPDVVVYRHDLRWQSVWADPATPKPPEGSTVVAWGVETDKSPSGSAVARSFQETPRSRVQVIPGAKDRSLFDAVLKRAGTAPAGGPPAQGDALQDYVLFEGPPAKTPRVESEVFYVDGKKEDAEQIAKVLEPILGAIAPKQWPGGKWDYDVVVVVGARRAQRP